MGWEVLVIPIIGVAVWIISTLIRGAEEAKQAKAAERKRPEKVTDVDRFLREVQRRRQEAEREEQRPQRVELEEEEEEERVQRRQPRPRAKWRTPPGEEDIPTVIPVEPVPLAQPVSAVSLVPVMRTVEAPPLPVMPADTSPASLPAPPESRALVGLRELLRSRDGLRKALILREVLGPPLARRFLVSRNEKSSSG